MLAFKEFADFISLNKANLAATYARLLAESGEGYENIPDETRLATARKLLKAVIPGLSDIKPGRPQLFPSGEDLKRVNSIIHDRYSSDMPIVSVAPGSVWLTKRWPVEYFEKLIKLLEGNGIGIIIIGGEEDKDIADRLYSCKVLSLAGELTLLESAAAISLTKAIVTNDSAPLHMASAMDIPTVAIFGATTSIFGFGPLADNSVILEKSSLECRPCGRHGGNKCRKKHFNCMNEISPESVFEEVMRIISGS